MAKVKREISDGALLGIWLRVSDAELARLIANPARTDGPVTKAARLRVKDLRAKQRSGG